MKNFLRNGFCGLAHLARFSRSPPRERKTCTRMRFPPSVFPLGTSQANDSKKNLVELLNAHKRNLTVTASLSFTSNDSNNKHWAMAMNQIRDSLRNGCYLVCVCGEETLKLWIFLFVMQIVNLMPIVPLAVKLLLQNSTLNCRGDGSQE